MIVNKRKVRFYALAFLKHDFRASITVFFVALPLCLGVALASGAPVYSGIVSGIIGGLIVSLISNSQLSVSGPAAGLTAICAAAITKMGALEIFLLSVSVAGLLQVLVGVFKLAGFTHFIPSAVIKGMLAAIGVILISKQIPLLIGYDEPDFYTGTLFNIITLDHSFQHIHNLYDKMSFAAIFLVTVSFVVVYLWNRFLRNKIPFLPSSFVVVLAGILLAILFEKFIPSFQLQRSQYVNIPEGIFSKIKFPHFNVLFSNAEIWKNAVVICFVASLETLLSVEAIDKLDPYNRITPQNREMIAQGTGNFLSGLLGGLPITAVIVRSSANAEAGARTKLASFTHGMWLLLVVLFAVPLVNMIPYCILAAILIKTGYNLAKPKMIYAVYKQGREQFMPFIVTLVSILFTDLLIGVLIGMVYAIYFIIKHTYRGGYVLRRSKQGTIYYYVIDLALNVSFLNKGKIKEMLDKIPPYSVVEIKGTDSVYIDQDILEIFQEFKPKAHLKHIQLKLKDIPEVETIAIH
jgi:MFS superfamily sulfate permease-like transporter